MHLPFLHPHNGGQSLPKEGPPSVVNLEPESHSMAGSEFLDDALRMEDLPVAGAEEIAAAEMPADTEKKDQLLDETLDHLKKRGYVDDLNFETDTVELYGRELDMRQDPETFHVDEIDRIGDEASGPVETVYAISSATGVKGFITTAMAFFFVGVIMNL